MAALPDRQTPEHEVQEQRAERPAESLAMQPEGLPAGDPALWLGFGCPHALRPVSVRVSERGRLQIRNFLNFPNHYN